MNTDDLYEALSMPFPSEMIHWRVGSTNQDKTKGKALAYLDARDVMDRLDQVCGFDGWQCNYTPGVGGSIVCNIGIRIAGDWIWKADGAGATDFEGEKGALSDAFKRSAVRFGVSRYLYGLDGPWVAIEPAGKSYKIAKTELGKLEEMHEKQAQAQGWGSPNDRSTYRFLAGVVRQFVTDAASAHDFREANKNNFQLLRVGAKRHLFEMLDRAGAPAQEAAE
jgi:hypothetical protein